MALTKYVFGHVVGAIARSVVLTAVTELMQWRWWFVGEKNYEFGYAVHAGCWLLIDRILGGAMVKANLQVFKEALRQFWIGNEDDRRTFFDTFLDPPPDYNLYHPVKLTGRGTQPVAVRQDPGRCCRSSVCDRTRDLLLHQPRSSTPEAVWSAACPSRNCHAHRRYHLSR